MVTTTGSSSQAASAAPRLLKAGELARRTGLTRQALHQYVQMGLIAPADATSGGQRLFGPEAAKRITMIRKTCAANGYSLQAFREVFRRARGGRPPRRAVEPAKGAARAPLANA
jgi:DNA-binding transcriptional MerR regulator